MSYRGERVTICGAGVIGLTTALLLAEAGFTVDIVARDLPLDTTSQQFASPWAGANWHSFMSKSKPEDQPQRRWEAITFKKIWDLIPSGLAMKLECLDYYESKPDHWFQDLTPNYRELPTSELPASAKYGVTFDTWSINAPEYIKWLAARLELLHVPITRATLTSLEEPYLRSFTPGLAPASIVVNATGLGARSLIGVEDPLVHPVRGQTVLIWAPHYTKTVSMYVDDPKVAPMYIIPRPNGECVLGGTFLVDDWNLSPNTETTRKIIHDALAFEPSLSHNYSPNSSKAPDPETIPVIGVNVGLRPARRGAARLEKESITVPFGSKPYTPKPKNANVMENLEKKEVTVIHAYGLGSGGFQSSWGMAEEAVALVKEAAARK